MLHDGMVRSRGSYFILTLTCVLLSLACSPEAASTSPRPEPFSDPEVSIPDPNQAPVATDMGLSEGALDVALLSEQPSFSPNQLVRILLKSGYTITRQGEPVYRPELTRDVGLQVDVIQVDLLVRSLERPMEFRLRETMDNVLSAFPEPMRSAPLFVEVKKAYLKGLTSTDRKVAYAAEVFLALGSLNSEVWDVSSFEAADEVTVSYLQWFLMSTRLAAEAVPRTERPSGQGSSSSPLFGSSSDCSPGGSMGVIYDAMIAGESLYFDFAKDVWRKYGFLEEVEGVDMRVGLANAFLSFLELGMTQLFFEIRLGYENAEELERETSRFKYGKREGIRGVVRMKDVEGEQWLNCARVALAPLGIDFTPPEEGPVSGVPVDFQLIAGGVELRGGRKLAEGFVHLPRLDSSQTTRTNEAGEARIYLEGLPQSVDLGPNPRPTRKFAIVRMSSAVKANDLLKDSLKLVPGAKSFTDGDPGTPFFVGALNLVPEMLMRSKYSVGLDQELPVKDWEPTGGWSGNYSFRGDRNQRTVERRPGGGTVTTWSFIKHRMSASLQQNSEADGTYLVAGGRMAGMGRRSIKTDSGIEVYDKDGSLERREFTICERDSAEPASGGLLLIFTRTHAPHYVLEVRVEGDSRAVCRNEKGEMWSQDMGFGPFIPHTLLSALACSGTEPIAPGGMYVFPLSTALASASELRQVRGSTVCPLDQIPGGAVEHRWSFNRFPLDSQP